MIIIIETVILCIAFFLICFWGTGTDNKNLKSYSSYPDEVQNRIKSIAEYQGKFKESNKVVTFISNFLLFLFVLFILGLFIKENGFTHNFLCLSIIGQGLNIFDLFIVDLLWWRNTKRAVSYTHLDVYKRQAAPFSVLAHTALPISQYSSVSARSEPIRTFRAEYREE